MRIKTYITCLSVVMAVAGLSSCSRDNDMRFPVAPADITAFEIYGQNSARIDTRTLTVSVVLGEDVKPENLNIKTVRFTEGAWCADPSFASGRQIDLSSPKEVTLTKEKDYVWTISATQPIERYVQCEGQVGDAIIHEDTRTVNVTVKTDKKQYIDSRTSLVIKDMKLGIKGSEVISTTGMEKDGTSGEYVQKTTLISGFPVTLDCFLERTFIVRHPDGSTAEWTMIVLAAE